MKEETEPTKLEKLAQTGYLFACQRMIGTKNDMMPFFVLMRGDKFEVIATPFANDQEKKAAVFNVVLEIAKGGCDAWSFLSESWLARRKPGEALGPRPADDPRREEGVICIVSDGKDSFMYSWKTLRDKAGNCIGLEAQSEAEHFESWICSTLNRAKALYDILSAGGSVKEVVAELERLRKKSNGT